MSRENILKAVQKNQPALSSLSEMNVNAVRYNDHKEKFSSTLQGIGGIVIEVSSWEEIAASIKGTFHSEKRIVCNLPEIKIRTSVISNDPHQLENVDLAVIKGEFGVAENGAVWMTDDAMGDRALPFICQHLAIVINKSDIVHTLHEAYDRIGQSNYNLGIFIAGPSKTADIEQSLVLGAHGARSLTAFVIG